MDVSRAAVIILRKVVLRTSKIRLNWGYPDPLEPGDQRQEGRYLYNIPQSKLK